jgi:microsomal dipeptidase-like Zn-dependent dipeptidase
MRRKAHHKSESRWEEDPMKRRDFLAYALALGATTALGAGSVQASWPGRRKVTTAPSGMVIVDAHAHPDHFYNPSDPTPDESSTLDKITDLGMQGSNFAAVGDNTGGSFTFSTILNQIRYVNDIEGAGSIEIIRTPAGARSLAGSRAVPGAILCLEGASPMAGTWEEVSGQLDTLYGSGVRMITVMHYVDNQFGEIMKDRPGKTGAGLSELGRLLVKRMIKLGMVVDGAHAHYATLKDMVKIAMNKGVPVIDSHTSLSPAQEPTGSRLRTWDEMKMIADTGGLICTWPLRWETVGTPYHRLTIGEWAEENRKLKKKLGIEHIALGTDGGGKLPVMVDGYASILDIPQLADAMHEAGFTWSEVERYMGKNFRRVLRQCLKG